MTWRSNTFGLRIGVFGLACTLSLLAGGALRAQVTAGIDADGNIEIRGTPTDDTIFPVSFGGRMVIIWANDGAGNATTAFLQVAADARIKVEAGNGKDLVVNGTLHVMLANGGGGTDLLISGPRGDYNQGGIGTDVLLGDGGDDILDGGGGTDWISGSADDDILDGEVRLLVVAGADYIFAGAGDDVVDGGPGDDWIWLGDGKDVAEGKDGNDTIFGGPRVDEVYGGADNDILCGWTGNDILHGGPGDDHIYGEQDADAMDGAVGNDHLYGDPAEGDTFLNGAQHIGPLLCLPPALPGGGGGGGVEAESGITVVAAAGVLFLQGSEESDIIDLSVSGEEAVVSIRAAGHDPVGYEIEVAMTDLTVVAELHGGNDRLRVSGSFGQLVVLGGVGHDEIDAGESSYSRAALIGGEGHDSLRAGAGPSLLVGGEGEDRLVGGSEADVFAFANLRPAPASDDPSDVVLDLLSESTEDHGRRMFSVAVRVLVGILAALALALIVWRLGR